MSPGSVNAWNTSSRGAANSRTISISSSLGWLICNDSVWAILGPLLSRVHGGFQCGDVDLLHLQHGLHGPVGARPVGIAEQARQRARNDLPGDAEAVLQPTALAGLPALDEPPPVVVDLLLIGAVDVQRDGLVELELGPAVEGVERHSADLEGHAGARLARWRAAEDLGVEARGFLRLAVEPQERCHLLDRKSTRLNSSHVKISY